MADDRGWPALLGIGAAAAMMLMVGVGLGFVADRGLNTYPVFILIGLVLGIAAACRYTYGEFRKSLDD